MSLDNFIHILNPNKSNKRRVKRFFKKHPDLKAVWVDRTMHPTHLETIVEWALHEGRTNFAVWGGDGTFSRVLQRLYLLKKLETVTLCLIPTGTCNDFARKLEYPSWLPWSKQLDMEKCKTCRFDLGLVQFDGVKRIFENNSGFGRSREAMERKKSKPLKDIKEFKPKRLQVEWKTSKVSQYETLWSFFGIVFNAPFFNKGMHFAKDIEPDDGLLNAFIVPPQKESKMLFKFLKSKFGASLQGKKDIRIDAEQLSIDSDQLVYPQADGESIAPEGTKDLRYTVIPGAFKLVVPNE